MVEIRDARPADLAAIQQCARRAYQRFVAAIGREPAPMIADFATQISQGKVMIAAQNNTLLGFIVAYGKSDHFHIENVAVDPGHHGKGVGRALIDHAETMAQNQGFARIELYTNAKMTPNLTLYPHLGYVKMGEKQEDGFERVFFGKDVPV